MKCEHSGDYRIKVVDIDQHEITVCVGCGEQVEL
jgi:hypothetical protein